MRAGVLPDWRIKELMAQGVIIGADPNLVNTSSLDLRIANDRWKLLGSFLPRPGQSIEEALKSREIVDAFSGPDRFYVDHLQQYAMRLIESLDLPITISARIFNKSGRGRIGVSLRGLTDEAPCFDVVREGYKGAIYVEISSTVFPLVVHSGQTAIPQIRFYEGNPEPLSGSELELELKIHPILTDERENRTYNDKERAEMIRTGKLTFTADIPLEGLLAYKGMKDKRILDLSQINTYVPVDYFEEVTARKGRGRSIILHPGDFVLVKSKENIRLPPYLAAEIDEYSSDLGDMKSHYAGLINASHGYNKEGVSTPSNIVFEIRARDQPIIIQDGQRLAKFNLYRMLGEPEGRYMERRSTGFGDLPSILPSIFKKD